MAATPPPGRKKIKRSNLLSKRSSTGFLGFPPRHCQKGVFTFGLVGPRLYSPSSPDVSVVFPWLEDAWPIISWRPCRIRTCPPKKNDGLQCLSSCFIIFSTKSAIGYGAMPRYDIGATWVSEKYRLFCRHEVWNLGLGWQGGNGQEQY